MGCLEPILPGAGVGQKGSGLEKRGLQPPPPPHPHPPASWVEVGISRLKRLLSQTPLRQGQSQGGLGPFWPPRTLGLPGAPRATQRPWPSPAFRSLRPLPPQPPPPPPAPPFPPQPRCLGCEALEWAPARAGSPKFPQAHNPQALQANRFPPPPVSALGSGRHLEAALLPLPLTSFPSPFLPALYGPLEPEEGSVAPSPPRRPGPRHPAPSSGRLQDTGIFLRHPASPGSSTDFFSQQRNSISTLLNRIWTQKTPVSRKYNHLSKSVIYMHFNSLGIESQLRVPQHGVKYNQSLSVILYIL